MSTSRVVFALVLMLAAAACEKKEGGGSPTVCGKYADMEAKCNGGDGVRSIARSTCEDAQQDKDRDAFSAMIALEATCAQTEPACDAYAACIEKAKENTTPPGM